MDRWDINFQQVTVKMSDGSMFTGNVNIRNYKRLSDFFKGAEDRFIVICPEVEDKHRAFMVNKEYIIWVESSDAECKIDDSISQV
ncbi:MAG: hypothetical protein ABIJ37_00975 [Pseudomonadota bacterium]